MLRFRWYQAVGGYGGGVALLGVKSVIVSTTTFSRNVATLSGGGVYSKGDTSSGNGGSTWLLTESVFSMSACTFVGNSGQVNPHKRNLVGGGLYIDRAGLVMIRICTFLGNAAPQVHLHISPHISTYVLHFSSMSHVDRDIYAQHCACVYVLSHTLQTCVCVHS